MSGKCSDCPSSQRHPEGARTKLQYFISHFLFLLLEILPVLIMMLSSSVVDAIRVLQVIPLDPFRIFAYTCTLSAFLLYSSTCIFILEACPPLPAKRELEVPPQVVFNQPLIIQE